MAFYERAFVKGHNHYNFAAVGHHMNDNSSVNAISLTFPVI